MLAKYITAGLAGSALLATVAFAQNPTATTDSAKPAPAAASDSSFQGNWRASKIVGLSVYNDKNESVGSVGGCRILRHCNRRKQRRRNQTGRHIFCKHEVSP